MRKSRLRLSLALGGVAIVAAACNGGGGGGGFAAGIDSLGASFVAAFKAAPNSEPVVDAQDVTLVLTPSIEPFDPNPVRATGSPFNP